jgi:hypothetical protein
MLAAQPIVLLHLQRLVIFFIVYYIIFEKKRLFSCSRKKKKISHFNVLVLKYIQVVHDKFGIVEGLMSTIHSITGKYVILCYALFLIKCL